MITTTTTLQNQQPLASQNYPFMDSATMRSRTNVFVPPSVFLDARLYSPHITQLQYISSITVTPGKITISIDNPSSTTGTVVITELVNASSNATNTVFPVLDKYGRDVGVLVLDPFLLQAIVPVNTTQQFDSTSMPFAATVIMPQPWNGVNGIVDENESYASGDVWLIGEDGIILEYDASSNGITVHAVGDPLYVRKACLDEGTANSFQTRRPLKKLHITGLPSGSFTVNPDSIGNIQLMLDKSNENICRLITVKNGLQLLIIGGNS